MIYTLTLNPALDYVVDVPGFQEGTVNRSKEDIKYPGGKGINVSRVLHRLGCSSTALGFAGGFTGDYIEQILKQEKINTDFVSVEGDTRINVKIRGEEETEVNGVSPHISEKNCSALAAKLEKLQTGDQLVLAGSLPSALSDDFYQTLMAGMNEKNVRLYLDTSGAPLKAALQTQPYFTKPNHKELGELYETSISSVQEAVYYGKRLMEDYKVQHVVISMAGDGAVYLHAGGAYQALPPRRKAVNSVGAGDSLVAGFIAGEQQFHRPEEVLAFAVGAGSATAFSETFCTKEEVEQMQREVAIKILEEQSQGEC
ncbi:1-phosphofructokinase [Salibacterium aidingense]|uniref:1-phosphofructokinase n=1 Tax=Salibacterium aidingense TaxID=384933 RepID=UPI00041BD803|nr:1-phosphofructokinase [Salibacterium aidingense]